MIARKLVRLFGWMIASTAGIFLLYNLYNLVMNNSFSSLLNFPTLFQTGLFLIFLVGLVLSTQNQILGGILTTSSPLIYIGVRSITEGQLVTPIFFLLMLIGGIFLLFTAEQGN